MPQILVLLQICSRIVITFFHFNIVTIIGFNQVSFFSIFSPSLSGLGQFSPNLGKVDPKSQFGEGPDFNLWLYIANIANLTSKVF